MSTPLRLTFRAQLLAIVGVAGVAFVLLIIASGLISARAERQLAAIQDLYVPKAVLKPELEGALDKLGRGFQDAVAAHDRDALAGTRALKARFLARLGEARGAVDPAEATALDHALEDYDATALDVSRRLIADETGEGVVESIGVMQAKRARVDDALAKVAAVDGADLKRAFAAAAAYEVSAQAYRFWISLACLAVVLALSLVLSRSLVRSVDALSAGLARFGAGDFDHPIEGGSADELGDLA
ncbi:MAG TPA: HAMP domain-containing protein, partial [Byssovorax sp.]